MDVQPTIATGKMVEVVVVLERAHAGPSEARFQKKVPRDGKLVPVMESYICFFTLSSADDSGEGEINRRSSHC